MALERKWAAVPPQAFTSNGTAQGLITLADTSGFRTKQIAFLKKNATDPRPVQVKRVLSPTLLIVGLPDNKISAWLPLDISAYTVVSGATIAAEEQNKNNIPSDDHYSAIYESDPVVADRVVQVDKYGNFYDHGNPLPISLEGSISIGAVSIVDESSGVPVKVNSDGSINVNVSTGVAGTPVLTYNEISAVTSGSTTTVVTYTVPPLTTAKLETIMVSGENIAKYDVLLNSSKIATKRTYFGGELNNDFNFSNINLVAGDIITVKVVHDRPSLSDFEATIQVIENT